jgi:hypothetical protein
LNLSNSLSHFCEIAIFQEEEKEDFQFDVTALLALITGYASSYRRRIVKQTNACNPHQIHRRA